MNWEKVAYKLVVSKIDGPLNHKYDGYADKELILNSAATELKVLENT